jgi:hypothetical protein
MHMIHPSPLSIKVPGVDYSQLEVEIFAGRTRTIAKGLHSEEEPSTISQSIGSEPHPIF